MQDMLGALSAPLPEQGLPVDAGLPADPALGQPAPQAPSPYPSTDPAFVDALLSELLAAREQDHSLLAQDQDAAVQQSTMFQALMGGAPMGPGAGQEAQGVGFDPSVLPAPPEVM